MQHAHLPTPGPTRHDLIDAGGAAPERVLVVVFLRGGADGLTLVPAMGEDAYRAARPTLAVPAGDAIDLDGRFALHRRLAALEGPFKEGRLSIVHGCGSEDDTRSHFEAQDTMEHGGDDGSGWLGRFLRARGDAASALSAVAIGTTRPESLRGAPGGAVMQSVREFGLAEDDPSVLEALERLYARATGPLGLAGRDTVAAVRRLRALRAETVDGPLAPYPATSFGRGLREIVRLVRADVGLVASTIDLGGWDTHFVQARVIGGLMSELAAGLAAFDADLGELRSRVDLVVMTEFGRRLKENSSFGTDHGAGGVFMHLGPTAEALGTGGRVRAGFPDLDQSSLDAVGDIPADIDYRSMLGPVLAQHAPGVDLGRVFPGGAAEIAPE